MMAEYCEFEWSCRHIGMSDASPTKAESLNGIQDKSLTIQAVQNLIPTRPEIEFQKNDDNFILRFLNARKNNVRESFELMANYYSYRQRNRQLFENFVPQDIGIQQALHDGFPGVLPERDRKGRCVLVIFTANWDHCAYSLEVIYRALLLTLERLIEKPRNQVNGFVVVVDWSEFSFRQSSSLNPRVLKLMIEGLQDCFPARFKGIHFISQPWYVEAALTVIRPFLKEKTKDKIFLHGNNLSTLHDYIAKDILPAELGGEAPSYNPLLWANEMLELPSVDKMCGISFNDVCCPSPERKTEKLATGNNFRDKPVEEKNGYLQENGLGLS
ncbi:clavesin-2-like isoform X3 [Zootermopsis nevadensis]|nr:clavesin-2-like isoform X3 [Zootermopsis nevadensis]XP_021932784.1 clavesin-2-like isoform X3 [Zootermopsis nevadensis]XP_021932785.1 clavesin-2-like isoform X3 [Zootermopsis nevadensis]XP_021932786.1 clavesin-2-like isoform X3 [Zootermopsis nevadensis]